MKTIHIKSVALVGFTLLSLACTEDKKDETPIIKEDPPAQVVIQTISEKAQFGIGAAVTASELTGTYSSTLKSHFTQITGEYEMKMGQIWTGEDSYKWSNADALVDYAASNNLDVHGHTLLWYSNFPSWFKNANYDSAKFETLTKKYIETVVGRYKGKVISWDVANEIFNDNGTLRIDGCPVYKTFKDPIAFYGRAFQYARDTDPDAKLFYNDYSVVLAAGKRNAMKQMVTRFKNEGYPIDGLGDQFHYMVSTDRNTIKNGLADMGSTGLLIHLSELDIRVNVNKSDNYVYTEAEQTKHAEVYKDIVTYFEALPQAQKFGITTWGLSDKKTWLTDWWHPKEYPLLFDADFKRKKTYEGFLQGLK